jgi:hypothetical protein
MKQTNKFRFFFQDRLVAYGMLAAVGLYGVSFFLPATEVFGTIYGWNAFLAGAQLPFATNFPISNIGDFILSVIGWSPNPFFWLGIVLLTLRRWHAATASGIIALLGAFIWVVNFHELTFDFKDYREGYYVWLASMGLLAGLGCWRTLYPSLSNIPVNKVLPLDFPSAERREG